MPNLFIDVEARFAQVQDALAQISRNVERRTQGMSRAFSAVASALSAIGASLSVGGLVAFVNASVDAAAALDDIAEKTGASVEELSKLQQVARISGTDFGVVETFLVKLNKALHETDEEAKKANRALKAIGLNAAELRTLDPAEAMRRIAVELTKFADSGGKTAAILSLTGKSAAEALPFLKDLANEVGVVSRVTAEQAAASEELQKAFRRITNEVTELSQALGRTLVPKMLELLELFNESRRVAGGFLELFALRAGNPIQALTGNVQSLTAKLEDYRKERDKLAAGGGGRLQIADIEAINKQITQTEKLLEIEKFRQRQQALALNTGRGRLDARDLGPVVLPDIDFKPTDGKKDKRFQNAIKQLEEETLKVQDLSRVQEILGGIENKRFGDLTQAQKTSLVLLAATVDANKEEARVKKEVQEAIENSSKETLEQGQKEFKRLTDLKATYIDLIDPLEKFRLKMIEVQELAAKGFLTPEQLNDAEFAIEKAANALSDMGEAVKENTDVAKELGLTFQSAFEDAILEGKKFRDVLQGILKDIGRIILRKGVTEPLADTFVKSDWAKALGAGVKGLFTRAGGGPVSSGQPYMVGERGPELFVPGTSGNIVPNDQLGGSFNVNVNFGSGPPTDPQAVVSALIPIMKTIARGEIGQNLLPGGVFNPT